MSSEPVIDEVATDDPVTMINAFSVPLDESELFLRRWRDNAAAMAVQQGFLGARMHRSLVDDAELRFVNVSRWTSGHHLAAARSNPQWRESMHRMIGDPGLHITARPSVYEVVADVQPEPTT